MNAKRFLTKDGMERVRGAVAQVERRTSAEFVCAVATESGRYDRAESIWGLLFGLVGLAIISGSSTVLLQGTGSWSSSAYLASSLKGLAVIGGFIVGSVLASVVRPLRMLLVSRAEMESEVARAAAYVFGLGRLRATQGGSGVLVYVSLCERRVVILADESASKVVGQAGLDGARDAAVACLKEGKAEETFIAAISSLEVALAEKLPAKDGTNELPDAVLVFPGRPE